MSRVGFVGAGRMGAPMIRRLADAGHDVRTLVRSPEKGAEKSPEKSTALRELGTTVVTDLAAVADEADAVIVCVFTDEQVRQVCLDSGLLPAMRPGGVVVVHTTGNPHTLESMAATAPRGVDIVDAPVSGGPHDVAAGHVTLFVGGGDAAVERVRPLLSSYGDPVLHVGPTGAGQRVKLINNTLFAAQIGLVAEAVRLGGRLGIDETVLLNALPNGSATSRVLDIIASRGSVEAFVETVGEFVGKDVTLARKIAAELGSDLGALDGLVGLGLEK